MLAGRQGLDQSGLMEHVGRAGPPRFTLARHPDGRSVVDGGRRHAVGRGRDQRPGQRRGLRIRLERPRLLHGRRHGLLAGHQDRAPEARGVFLREHDPGLPGIRLDRGRHELHEKRHRQQSRHGPDETYERHGPPSADTDPAAFIGCDRVRSSGFFRVFLLGKLRRLRAPAADSSQTARSPQSSRCESQEPWSRPAGPDVETTGGRDVFRRALPP